MGRTLPTFTRYLEKELASWNNFRRALSKEDREIFDRLFRFAKRHIAEASHAARPIPFDALILSILLEQQKEIMTLKGSTPAMTLKGSTPVGALGNDRLKTAREEKNHIYLLPVLGVEDVRARYLD